MMRRLWSSVPTRPPFHPVSAAAATTTTAASSFRGRHGGPIAPAIRTAFVVMEEAAAMPLSAVATSLSSLSSSSTTTTSPSSLLFISSMLRPSPFSTHGYNHRHYCRASPLGARCYGTTATITTTTRTTEANRRMTTDAPAASSSSAVVVADSFDYDSDDSDYDSDGTKGTPDASATDAPYGRFSDLPNLHPSSRRAVSDLLGTEDAAMTEIQHKTFLAASDYHSSTSSSLSSSPKSFGRDVLGRARTGTGKTLAFLLSALETYLGSGDVPGTGIGIVVISPTRELAVQIAHQARAITSRHTNDSSPSSPDSRLTTLVLHGGSSRRADVQRLESRLPTILVATPGRLNDHLDGTEVNGVRLRDIVRRTTRVVVLDETDRLLDMGFRADVERLLSRMPPRDCRQTLLFSATLSKHVRSIAETTMKRDYVSVDCVRDCDPATHVNSTTTQSHIIIPSDAFVIATVEIICRMMDSPLSSSSSSSLSSLDDDDDGPTHRKLIVFFPTTHLTSYFADLFNFGLGRPVIELHGRKSQSYRAAASDRFRKSKSGNEAGRQGRGVVVVPTLFTSDVSARGVDYPDVTDVIQVGMPDGRETYIHRLGRTGRAGNKGRGLIVLTEVERNVVKRQLGGLDVPENKELALLFSGGGGGDDDDDDAALAAATSGGKKRRGGLGNGANDSAATAKRTWSIPVSDRLERIRAMTSDGQSPTLYKAAKNAYRSMLGYYGNVLPHVGVPSKKEVIKVANGFATSAGLSTMPELDEALVRKMGLSDVARFGLNVVSAFGPNAAARGRNKSGGGYGKSNGGRRGRGGDRDGGLGNRRRDGGRWRLP